MKTKKIDIYFTDDGMASAYPRGEVDECGDLPDGEPLHRATADWDGWEDWCAENGVDMGEDDAVRSCKLVCEFPAAFAADLERKAQSLLDEYRAEGERMGWGKLEIDHTGMNYTFRSSAAWKDEPTMYTFAQPLKWTNRAAADYSNSFHLFTRDRLVRLWGMADTAHELGLDLVYDKDFKVKLMGRRTRWETKFEC